MQLKGFSVEDCILAVNYCQEMGYLDDERFAGLLLRSHIAKGHGPVRIRQAFMQKGLARDLIAQVLDASDCDWFELAREKALRKYQLPKTSDHKEKAKRIRYMMSQGFSYDQVAYALDYDPFDEN
nr:regulatory protein RecX [Shewanella sp. NFH-SH190041]